MNDLVIYHANCYDGFTAAWIAKQRYPDAELYPAKWGEPPPDVKGRSVFVLDFSYPREIMERMYEEAETLVVLDHHKTAQEACEGLGPWCQFDMDRSGCRMAWEFFCGVGPVPKWILRIEDRDLWRGAFGDTKLVHAYVASLPMTLAAWTFMSEKGHTNLVRDGAAIRRFMDTYIEKAAQEARVFRRAFGTFGNTIVAVNVPYQMASEMGHYLLEAHPEADYAMGYFQRADGRWQYSLRSKAPFDVSEIAKGYGGGGHAQAAGYDTAELHEILK